MTGHYAPLEGKHLLETGIIVAVCILVLLILARQVMTNRENRRLYSSLHDAYRELEEKNRQALDYAAQLEQLNGEMQAVQAELIRNNQELIEAKALWERLAITDTMTEIANHRAFQERLRAEVARAQRYNYSFVLLMVDVDKFKPYNDTYGHPAGDQVLRQIAAAMRETVREGDLVARYGGEEFAVLLPQTDAKDGRVVAERIRDAVGRRPFAYRKVTVSIGSAEFAADGKDAETLILNADRALYAAKDEGRNCVVFARDIARHSRGVTDEHKREESLRPDTGPGAKYSL
jgi:diguanylate cyclase (GGDEF)-like protein